MLKVQGRNERAMFQAKHGFDQSGDAGRGIKMPYIAFDRTDCAKAPPLAARAKRLRQGSKLNRVSKRGGRAMRLNITDRIG